MSDAELRRRVIRTLPGQKTSPRAFCGMLLELADDIEHIACVIQWKRNAQGEPTTFTNTASTEMTLGQAAWLRWIFDQEFPRTIEPDPDADPPVNRADDPR